MISYQSLLLSTIVLNDISDKVLKAIAIRNGNITLIALHHHILSKHTGASE